MWRALLFGDKHACLIEWLQQAENKFPAPCTLVVSGFILIHFNAAASAVIDSKGKDCSYTNHFSSGKNWFNDNIQWPQSMGQRERYIMRKGRQIMEDHRAISITLTSILEHSSPPYFKSTQWNRPVSELLSFPSHIILPSHPLTFDLLAHRHPAESHLGSQWHALLDDDHFSLQPHCFTPCGYSANCCNRGSG